MMAAIFGLAGPGITAAERAFFGACRPAGFILFKRNIETPDQVRRLTDGLRDLTGRSDLPILIDQEGGRVARLGPPHWPALPAARTIGGIHALDPARGLRAARQLGRVLGGQLAPLGITVNCTPVADVPAPGSHDIIGDRAFARDPAVVGELAAAVADGLLAEGVIPVVKHLPGHGRARVDSHHELPVVRASLDSLLHTDFQPFFRLHDLPWAMTAHVTYLALDRAAPATLSREVIETIIRGRIGFQGVLVSDDLSMAALSGDLASRARRALAAGCDLVLHCNGDMAEMRAVAHGTSPVSAHGRARLLAGEARRRDRRPVGGTDIGAVLAAFREALAI
ncbi:MAG: beta-N-acetylhexosaminidase [Alphaproteobacteria bacterium]